MKAHFRHSVKSFDGKFKSEGLVYCRYNQGALCIARKYPTYTPSVQNEILGRISLNLKELYEVISNEYKLDLRNYSRLMISYTNLAEKKPAVSYAIYTKMMWALQRKMPEIDLATITKAEILNREYPVRTIVEAMQAGLLLAIPEAGMLTQEM